MLIYMDDTPDKLNEQAKELQRLARELRRKEFQKLKDEGLTLQEIADKYNLTRSKNKITRQRVKQILDGE